MVRGGRKAFGCVSQEQAGVLIMGYNPNAPHRYDIDTDAMVNVTQEWVDDVQKMFSKFGAARGHARSFLKSSNANPEGTRKAIQAFMDAWKPEFEQKP